MSEKIYTFIAGPDCFYPDFEEVRAKKQALCRSYGLEPLPNDEFPDIVEPPVTSKKICDMNRARLDRCSLVLANLTAFRGTEPDAGTVWEAVYGFTKGKRVYAYFDYPDMIASAEAHYGPVEWREEKGENGEIIKKAYDRDGAFIEDWGSMLNLMLTGSFPCIHGSFEDLLEYVAKDLGLTKKD